MSQPMMGGMPPQMPAEAPSLETMGQTPDIMARIDGLSPEAKNSLIADFMQSLTTEEAEMALANAEQMGATENVQEPVQTSA